MGYLLIYTEFLKIISNDHKLLKMFYLKFKINTDLF